MLLVGLFGFCAFFWQTSACFVERAGIVACQEHHDETPANETGTIDCCHVESAGVFQQARLTAPVCRAIPHDLAPGRIAPDGPVAEIEYPPQLLS